MHILQISSHPSIPLSSGHCLSGSAALSMSVCTHCVCLHVNEEGGSGANVCCHISGFLNRVVSFLDADENQWMVGNKLLCVRTWEG